MFLSLTLQGSHLLVRYSRGAAAHDDHQGGSAGEQQHSKVEVMDPADYRGAVRGEEAAARPKRELRHHSAQPHGQSSHQTPESSLGERGEMEGREEE